MTGKPTDQELSDVLLEFHQRGQTQKKPYGPPPPFEITSTVTQHAPTKIERKRQEEDEPLIVPSQALVGIANDFEFWQYTATANQATHFITIFFYWRCANPGEIGQESYIRVWDPYWTAPGVGNIHQPLDQMAFNGTTWTPPSVDDHSALLISFTARTANLPPPHPPPFLPAILSVEFYIQRKSDGTLSDSITGYSQDLFWHWYDDFPHGIRANVGFVY